MRCMQDKEKRTAMIDNAKKLATDPNARQELHDNMAKGMAANLPPPVSLRDGWGAWLGV